MWVQARIHWCALIESVVDLRREQRVTLFLMAMLLGLSVLASSALKLLPLPLLYGIFLYIGVASLYGVQVYVYCKLCMETEI